MKINEKLVGQTRWQVCRCAASLDKKDYQEQQPKERFRDLGI